MSDIATLESRITAALDRIRAGLDQQPRGGGSSADLQAALTENAALHVQLEKLQNEKDSQLENLSERVASQRETLRNLDAGLQELRDANAALVAANEDLRNTAAEALGVDLVEASIVAELRAIKAERAAEAAEIAAIFAELAPLLEENANAAG